MQTLSVLAFVFAIIATVLAFVFIVPEKRRPRLNRFGKFVHDTLNFKYLILEKVLQALYIFATCYVILIGFCMLFQVEKYYSYYDGLQRRWLGGYGLLVMVLGPILVRLAYEGIMMFILLIKNVIQINNKLRYPEDYNEKHSKAAPAAPATPVTPVASHPFCTTCGAKLESGASFCTECGAKQ